MNPQTIAFILMALVALWLSIDSFMKGVKISHLLSEQERMNEHTSASLYNLRRDMDAKEKLIDFHLAQAWLKSHPISKFEQGATVGIFDGEYRDVTIETVKVNVPSYECPSDLKDLYLSKGGITADIIVKNVEGGIEEFPVDKFLQFADAYHTVVRLPREL